MEPTPAPPVYQEVKYSIPDDLLVKYIVGDDNDLADISLVDLNRSDSNITQQSLDKRTTDLLSNVDVKEYGRCYQKPSHYRKISTNITS